MQEPRSESNEVLPVPQMFHEHNVSILLQHALRFPEQVYPMFRGANLMCREQKKDSVAATLGQRQSVVSSSPERLR